MATPEEAQEVIRRLAMKYPHLRQTTMVNVNNWDSEIYEEINEFRIAWENSVSESIKT